MIMINVNRDTSIEKINKMLKSEEALFKFDENSITQLAESSLSEFNL